MSDHTFILTPSQWLGEGKIILNMVQEELSFFTRWNVATKDSTGLIECVQEIQVKGRTSRQGQKGTYSMILLETDELVDGKEGKIPKIDTLQHFGVTTAELNKIGRPDRYFYLSNKLSFDYRSTCYRHQK